MFKKCSVDQRFIRKRNTTYKIGTLVGFTLSGQILMLFHKGIDTEIKLYTFSEVHNLIFLGLHNSMFTHIQKTIDKTRLTNRVRCGT